MKLIKKAKLFKTLNFMTKNGKLQIEIIHNINDTIKKIIIKTSLLIIIKLRISFDLSVKSSSGGFIPSCAVSWSEQQQSSPSCLAKVTGTGIRFVFDSPHH